MAVAEDGRSVGWAVGNTGFELAVKEALDEFGTEPLGRPRQFVNLMADFCDPGSPEVTVLSANCGDELLRPYADAVASDVVRLGGTTDALGKAAARGECWLHDVRFVDARVAHSVAWGIARGVAAHLGVEPPLGSNDLQKDDDVAVVHARTVLGNPSATEAELADALAALGALPVPTAEVRGLTAGLERALARREEERKAREEAERKAREEAERKAREEAERIAREAAEREAAEEIARRKAQFRKYTLITTIVLIVIAYMCVVVLPAKNSKDGGLTSSSVSASSDVATSDSASGSANADTADFEAKSGISDYSWPELKAISLDIANAKSDEEGLAIARDYHLVDENGKLQGDTKSVQLSDGTMANVRILGFRHDELADGGMAGISFEFADVPVTHRMNAEDTNEGGWEASEMRAWLNSDFFGKLPEELQSCISVASKKTNNVGGSINDDPSVVSTTDDKLWLLAVRELYAGEMTIQNHVGPDESVKEISAEGFVPCDNPEHWVKEVLHSETFDAEGSQYQLYTDHDVTPSAHDFLRKEVADRASSEWWLRSTTINLSTPSLSLKGRQSFEHVDAYNGGWSGSLRADVEAGVSPGFCF